MRIRYIVVSACLVPALAGAFEPIHSQDIKRLNSHPGVSLRGLCVAGKNVVWVSGSGGWVARTVDGGAHWHWLRVPGYGQRDFRDIQAFDSATAILMAIDTPAEILRTTDGGGHWSRVYENDTAGMFLDAMDIRPSGIGMVVGDPVGGRFFLAQTADSGARWTPLPFSDRPVADSGEGCFASSGTNVHEFANGTGYAFVSGGPVSRLFFRNRALPLDLLQGRTSAGANGLGTWGRRWIVVGGDFARDTVSRGNCLVSTDGGLHWRAPNIPPHGYRSCVAAISPTLWVCCGTSGVDVSRDGGLTWTLISHESYHACAVAPGSRTVYLAGAGGRIAVLAL